MSTVEELQAELAELKEQLRKSKGQTAQLLDECYRLSNTKIYWERRFKELEAGGRHD
jgi:predicted nuclease with TOPRIM domain